MKYTCKRVFAWVLVFALILTLMHVESHVKNKYKLTKIIYGSVKNEEL